MTETYIKTRRRRRIAKSDNSKVAKKKENCWVAATARVPATAVTATAATAIVSAPTAPGPLLKSPTPEKAPATATATEPATSTATAVTVSGTTAPAQGATAKKGEAAIAPAPGTVSKVNPQLYPDHIKKKLKLDLMSRTPNQLVTIVRHKENKNQSINVI